MKFLVTGGSGFIGSHLMEALQKSGHKVVNLDIKNGYDIRNYKSIKPLFNAADGVFHLAAIPRVPLSVKDPVGTAEVNIGGTINVFTAAKEAGVKRVVYSSSSSVYGDQEILPLREDLPTKPISPYGLQKLVGELHAKLFSQLYGLPIISLRYFNVYGPGIDLEGSYASAMGAFIKAKRAGQPLPIYGDGEQTRGFSYVSDVVDATSRAFFSEKLKGGEVINIGALQRVSVNRLAQLFGGAVVHLEPRLGDIRHSFADSSLAKKLLDWEPKITIEEGVGLLKMRYEKLENKI
jgi:UDP-glucose 4-epimerase